MLKQGELFADARIVPGLQWVGEAVSEAEERALAARIDAAPLAPFQFGQWQGKRLTTHYGSGYDFGSHRLAEAPPLPDWLLELRDKLALRRRAESGFERRGLDLPPRSLYLLSGEVRSEWEHSIAPLDVTRRSITFRTRARC